MKKQENAEKKKTKIEFKLYNGKTDLIIYAVIITLTLGYFLSPKMYLITTAEWNDWNEENTKNVVTAMGEENTEERFRLYFQYYNVVHEMGHGLLRYNDGVKLSIADEEQLVNDFAVAYWNYYGEPEKLDELYDIVTYAVENVGDNYENGVDYLEHGREHSNGKKFDRDFFNFNDYGWFQFSSVKHSIEQNKPLEDVLKEMGFTNFTLTEKVVLKHQMNDEKDSTAVINEAVENFNEWGLYFPEAYQRFSDDPNMNVSGPSRNFFGIFNLL